MNGYLMSKDATTYYLFEIHEKVSNLEFITYVPHMVLPDGDVQSEADSCLLNWYDDGNGEVTEDYGQYTVDFNNDSVGYVTYKKIEKEVWNVLIQHI